MLKLAREAMMLGLADYNEVWDWYEFDWLEPEQISVRLGRKQDMLERV